MGKTVRITPRARKEGLAVQELEGELLVYDPETHRAHCLNQTARFVWSRCDGRTSVAEISRLLAAELNVQPNEQVVWLALNDLSRDRLLAEPVRLPRRLAGMTRRELIRRIGWAAAVSLPLVVSIVAPTAAQAGSACGGPCPCPPQCTCAGTVCV